MKNPSSEKKRKVMKKNQEKVINNNDNLTTRERECFFPLRRHKAEKQKTDNFFFDKFFFDISIEPKLTKHAEVHQVHDAAETVESPPWQTQQQQQDDGEHRGRRFGCTPKREGERE